MFKRGLGIILAISLAIPSFSLINSVEAMAQSVTGAGNTYYISNNGDNSGNGTSPTTAWQTLDKIYDIALNPGDQILLEKGSVFNGFIHLIDKHGTEGNPIKIGTYGDGNKPIINGNGEGIWYQDYIGAMDNGSHRSRGYVSSTILLYDVDFVEIDGLEITNRSDDADYITDWKRNLGARMDRTGIAGVAQNGGTMQHVYINNCYIHHVDGNIQDKHMNNGGIQFNAFKPLDESTGIARFDDIRITGNYVADVHRPGIIVGYTYQNGKFNGSAISEHNARTYGHTNIYLADNYIQRPGNDALCVMYAESPIVERNVSDQAGYDLHPKQGYNGYWQSFSATIWPWKTRNCILQYNEAFDTIGEGNGDGQAWDIDWSDGTIFQYNYSHNNGRGCMLVCLGEAYQGTFRYNLSYNDLGQLITLQGNPKAQFYNNTFYVGGDLATRIHHEAEGKRGGSADIRNNIFFNESSANPNDAWKINNSQVFSNNLYCGYSNPPESDTTKVVVPVENKESVFEGPRTAPGSILNDNTAFKTINPHGAYKDGIEIPQETVFDGFKLKENSPAINKGVYINNNGGKDFFGNPITTLVPDIGCHETNAEDTGVVEGLFSNTYNINSNSIQNVEMGTKVSELKQNLIYDTANKAIKVMSEETEVGDNDFITDQMTVKLTNKTGDEEAAIYTISTVWNLTSDIYQITSSGKFMDVPKDTQASTFISNLKYNSNLTAAVINGETELSDSDVLLDGMMLKLSAGESTKTYPISIFKNYQDYPLSSITATAGSWEASAGEGPEKAIDGNTGTLWHSAYSGADANVAKHWITLDLGSSKPVSRYAYTPRQNTSGAKNGLITGYELSLSNDGQKWMTIEKNGTWAENQEVKYVEFDKTYNARYIRLKSLRGIGGFASAAEIRVSYLPEATSSEIVEDEDLSVLTYVDYSRDGWEATAGSEETGGGLNEGPARLAIDGDNNTIWHTAWAGTDMSNIWITLNMGESQPVARLTYEPRNQSGNGGPNGAITQYEIYVSNDNTVWEKVATGSWASDNTTKTAYFKEVNTQYVKLLAIESHSRESGKKFGSAKEIYLGYVQQ